MKVQDLIQLHRAQMALVPVLNNYNLLTAEQNVQLLTSFRILQMTETALICDLKDPDLRDFLKTVE